MRNRAPTILCIDDDSETLKVRQLFLESFGYEVVAASSGLDALRTLSEGSGVDLVLLDYAMPGMNGDEVAARLRALYPTLPVVVVSAIAQLPASLLSRVDGYVQKGQDPNVLLGAISKVLMTQAKEAPSMENADVGHKTILCAEDEEEQLTSRRMVFESAGFQVLLARSGTEALQVFRDHAVDAVVLDYWMPGMKGLSVAREMKQLRPRTPVLVLSGFSALPGETIGLVDAWLQKRNVEPDELLAVVKRLLQEKVAKSPV